MAKKDALRFRSPDGIDWTVEVRSPGSSNAAVIFHHPDGTYYNRYAWYLSTGVEARSVTTRLEPDTVRRALDPETLAQLFRRSKPVETMRVTYNRQLNRAG